MILGVPQADEAPLFAVHRSSSTVIPNTLDMMSWDLTKVSIFIFINWLTYYMSKVFINITYVQLFLF